MLWAWSLATQTGRPLPGSSAGPPGCTLPSARRWEQGCWLCGRCQRGGWLCHAHLEPTLSLCRTLIDTHCFSLQQSFLAQAFHGQFLAF